MNLQNKIAVVTGAATGIGHAIAAALAHAGAAVVVDYVGDAQAADDLVSALRTVGSRALAVAADVSDGDQVEMLFASAVREFGRVDILVNNAGIEHEYAFVDTPRSYWEKVVSINLTGPFLCSQAAARHMIAQGGGGRIINISSVHEDVAMPTNAPYCATKGGVRMLMRTIAVELAPHQITVNNIAPGAIDTPMDAPLKANPEKMAALRGEIPLGRMGKPEEVAGLCVFLASDAASYMTGGTFLIDGGMSRQAGSL